MRAEDGKRVSATAGGMGDVYERLVQRAGTVEHPFGTMKWWWDGGYFLVKGLRNVRGEFSLMTLAYNLRRVVNLLGVECVLEALRTGEMPPLQPA